MQNRLRHFGSVFVFMFSCSTDYNYYIWNYSIFSSWLTHMYCYCTITSGQPSALLTIKDKRNWKERKKNIAFLYVKCFRYFSAIKLYDQSGHVNSILSIFKNIWIIWLYKYRVIKKYFSNILCIEDIKIFKRLSPFQAIVWLQFRIAQSLWQID